MAEQHYPGQGWSERNPIPTVEQFRQTISQREHTSTFDHSKAEESTNGGHSTSRHHHQSPVQSKSTSMEPSTPPLAEPPASMDDKVKDASRVPLPKQDDTTQTKNGAAGLEEKERIKKQHAPKPRPIDFEAQGERVVTDPVTGGAVQIRDASENTKIHPDKLDSRYGAGFSINVPKDSSKLHPIHTAPYPAEPSNILLYPFPPPVQTDAMVRLKASFDHLSYGLALALAIFWFFAVLGVGWRRVLFRTCILATIGFLGWSALRIELRKIEKHLEQIRAEMQKQRGENFSPPMPESVEWLNAAITCIWKQLNPDMCIAIIDTIEDIMQQSLPGFVDAVKVDDVGTGNNPFRLVSMRGLADTMGDKDYPREEWIHAEPKQKALDEKVKSDEDADRDGILDEDESGDFVNYEVAFSYSSRPGQSSKDRADNVHLMIQFFLGAFDLFQIPLPIWIQIEHISGTARLRAQIVQDAPYIRNVTFTLMGVPRVEIAAIPLFQPLPNVFDLPLISRFVQSSIAAAANMYVAPKSMTLDVGQMLSGDQTKKDTDAVGVLMVHIEYGQDLSAQDVNGKSDPYVVLSFAKFGRPLYSTRIIFEDVNPVWMETAFLLVTKDDIRAQESLSIQLWDSDARTADDVVGRVNKPLTELVRSPNQVQDRKDPLMGFEDADKMDGLLKWKVAFYEKANFNKALLSHRQKEKEEKELSKAEKEAQRQVTAMKSSNELLAMHCPPDPDFPSGILSMIVHHISGLENRDVERGLFGKQREGPHGQDVEQKDSLAKKLPSAYVEFIVNDDIVYKTRVKQYTNMPFFEAGTEVFVRDWTRTEVCLAVRDARLREHDPLMGVVALDLSSLFGESCQVSRPFSIQDGVGFGKVHCSFVFRSIKAQFPKNLLGWDTATVELLSEIQIEADEKLETKHVRVSTGDDTRKVATDLDWDSKEGEALVRLPVYERYSSMLTFEVGGGGFGPFGRKPDAIAVCALWDLADDEVNDLELDLMAGQNLASLKRNYQNEQTRKTHTYQVVGKLKVKVRIDAGLDGDHMKFVESSASRKDRHEFEIYHRLEGMPKRAEELSHAKDDGEMDSEERKKTDRAKREALYVRHRGIMGYSAARTAVWAKDSVKYRLRKTTMKLRGKQQAREQTIRSEADG